MILSSYTEFCVAALKIGTADFIRKDSRIDEICARIEVAWKRRPQHTPSVFPISENYQLSLNCNFQTGNSILNINSQTIPLNGMLAEVLTILCQNQNSYLPKKVICQRIWHNDTPGKIDQLCDYISKLRKILKEDPTLEIRSSYGKGYCLKTSQDTVQ